YVVRLAAANADVGTTTLDGKLKISARSSGGWSGEYGVLIKARADDPTRFRAAIVYIKTGTTAQQVVETFDNLSMNPADPRYAVNVITSESTLVTAEAVGTPTQPADNTTPAMLIG